MNVIILAIGKNTLICGNFDFKRLSALLTDRDYEIYRIYCAETTDEINETIGLTDEDDLIIAVGETAYLFEALGDTEQNVRQADYFRRGERTFVVMPEFDERKTKEVVIPLLNMKSRKCFNTVIFRTYGKKEEELRDMLRDQIRNRNKILFDFYPEGDECAVHVRYSRNTSSSAVDDVIGAVGDVLQNCTYALKDTTLAQSTAELLMLSGAKLSIAESFTGGGVASALIAYPGMSKCLIESVVTYSNASKISRLGVSSDVIAKRGAVSDDCVFEMANGLLSDPECEIAVATTGNAGPTSEKDGNVGLYYIAIGDRNAVHIFRNFYVPENADLKSDVELRREITESGIKTALFELGRYLKNKKRSN